MMYFLGSCEYKWSHVDTNLEHMWIRRELGEEIFKTIELNGWQYKLKHINSRFLPEDTYCECKIFVDLPDSPETTHFLIKHPNVVRMEKI